MLLSLARRMDGWTERDLRNEQEIDAELMDDGKQVERDTPPWKRLEDGWMENEKERERGEGREGGSNE